MNRRTFAKTAALALAAATAIGGAAPAMAANACKNVQLAFENNTRQTINIVDVDYYDPAMGNGGGWRSEPIINEDIRPGATWRETRNLEKVNQRYTKVRFEYRKPGKFGGWSFKKYTVTTDRFLCDHRDEVAASVVRKGNFADLIRPRFP